MDIQQLQTESEILSLEAFNGSVSLQNALSKLPGYIDNTRDYISEQIKKVVAPVQNAFFGNKSFALGRTLKTTTYTDFKDVTLYVPEGLNTTYMEYLTVMENCADICVNMDRYVLDATISWLSKNLGKPSILMSVVSQAPKFSLEAVNAAEALVHSKLNERGTRLSELPYMKVIKSQGEWEIIFKRIKALEDQLDNSFHKSILDKAADTDQLLSKLMDRITSLPNEYKLSSQTLADLSAVAFAVARNLEFYGLTVYRINDLSNAISESAVKLNNILNQKQ